MTQSSADIVELVTNDLLAHGEFSSIPDRNRTNAAIAALAIVDMIRASLTTASDVAATAIDRCAKCGCGTRGEAALVGDQTWCHPCADTAATPSTHEALDNSQSLLVMLLALGEEYKAVTIGRDPAGITEAEWNAEGLTKLLTEQIIENRTALSSAAAQPPIDPDIELERDMWIAAAGGEAEIGKREATKAEALCSILSEAKTALVEFKRWCRTDISRKSWNALHALEDVLSRPTGPDVPLSDLANDLQRASSLPSTNCGGGK